MKPDAPTVPPRPGRSVALESIALVLLSLATVGTAWCSYQAAVWGGVAQRLTNLSAAASRRAAAAQLQNNQMAMLDVMLFSQYINARATTNEPLARFYADRFRGEAKAAFQAWLATQPFEHPDAVTHPFTTNFYQPRLLAEANLAETESQQLWQQGGDAGRVSRGYVLITVLLATALFCGGTASKFDVVGVRRAVLWLGLGTFIFAAVRLLSLPAQL